MKNSKIASLYLILFLLLLGVSGCVHSNYPPRYRYDYGYRIPPRPPRVIVVRPAPRVVYRNYPKSYRYKQYDHRNNGARRGAQPRSNRNYGRSGRGSSGPR